jgi:short-subunit dehydrogenase
MSSKRTALITGASSGIGYELARQFAHGGYDLVLVARNAERLAQVAQEMRDEFGVTARVLAKDLALAAAPEEIFTALQQDTIQIDVLVNNAGFSAYGPFAESDLTTQLHMLQVNIVALTHLTHLFLPGMLARRKGKILNVASLAALVPGPLMAVYSASKAYVLSFSESLTDELEGTGVSVTALCPGLTATGFIQRANMEDSGMLHSRLVRMMDAKTVARIAYHGLMNNRAVVIPGMDNLIMAQAVRLTPRALLKRLMRSIQGRGIPGQSIPERISS